MTEVAPPQDLVRTLTVEEAEREKIALLGKTGMTRKELEQRAERWDLDARERGILADIRSLEFLIQCATR